MILKSRTLLVASKKLSIRYYSSLEIIGFEFTRVENNNIAN